MQELVNVLGDKTVDNSNGFLQNKTKIVILLCDKAISVLLFLLVFLSPVIYVAISHDTFRLPKEVFAQILIALISGFWLIRSVEVTTYDSFKAFCKNFLKIPFVPFILIFILFCLLSFKNSSVFEISLYNLVNILLYFLLYLILFFNLKTFRQINIITTSAVFVAAFAAIYCVSQYYGYDPLFYPLNPSDKGSYLAAAFMDNSNLAAGYISVLVPVSVYKFFISKPLKYKFLYLVILLVLLSGILVTGNRTSLGACLFSSVLFVVAFLKFTKHSISRKKVILYASVIFLLMSAVVYKKGILKSLKKIPTAIVNSENDRILYWTTTFEMIKDKPLFGIGLGTFKLHYLDYRGIVLNGTPYFGKLERAEQAHNDYLQLWAEAGTPAFLSAIFIIFNYFIFMIKFILKGKNDSEVSMVLCFTCSIITILIYALATFPFHLVPTSVLFVFFVGSSVWIVNRSEEKL